MFCESIDSSHDISCPVNNQGFCKQLSSYTKVAIFSSKHWAGLSPSGCTFILVSDRYEAQTKCRRVNESESDEEFNCLDWSWNFNIDVSETFLNLAVHIHLILHLTLMNLPNVARYGREMSTVILSFPFPL